MASRPGSCTAITVRMYIERKEWPMEGMDVFLTHEKQGDRDVITREIVIHGKQLSDEQRQRIMEIADKCPVHKMLAGSADITSRERQPD